VTTADLRRVRPPGRAPRFVHPEAAGWPSTARSAAGISMIAPAVRGRGIRYGLELLASRAPRNAHHGRFLAVTAPARVGPLQPRRPGFGRVASPRPDGFSARARRGQR
jgi:hypothetical protein